MDHRPEHELIAVMPVYNEAGCIARVVEDWLAALEGTGADFRLLVFDDGSTDSTPQVLAAFADHPRVELRRGPNRGHGPTLRRAYAEAAPRAQWVFQTDSDDELPASAFAGFWQRRHEAPFLLGRRSERRQGPARRLITATLSLTTGLLFGTRGVDVNCPYRLIRAGELAALLPSIPEDSFAPNAALTALAARHRIGLRSIDVPYRPRASGRPSLVRWRLWRGAARAFAQTLALAWRAR